jgi:hypothetical protein
MPSLGTIFPLSANLSVTDNGAVCDQKISKFFVSHVEESIMNGVN